MTRKGILIENRLKSAKMKQITMKIKRMKDLFKDCKIKKGCLRKLLY
jgi:hypothetical protein